MLLKSLNFNLKKIIIYNLVYIIIIYNNLVLHLPFIKNNKNNYLKALNTKKSKLKKL